VVGAFFVGLMRQKGYRWQSRLLIEEHRFPCGPATLGEQEALEEGLKTLGAGDVR
jgi:hypothetical protein